MSFRRLFNKEPAMVISGIIAVFGISFPWVVVPIRRSLGLDTYAADADLSHPELISYDETTQWLPPNDKKLLAEFWNKYKGTDYHRSAQLPVRAADDPERDFPEARARLAAKDAAFRASKNLA